MARNQSAPLTIEELQHFHSGLTPAEREELLECLLIAAARGGDAMLAALKEAVFVSAARGLIDNVPSTAD